MVADKQISAGRLLSWSREGLAPNDAAPEAPKPPEASIKRPPPLAVWSPRTEQMLQAYLARGGVLTDPSNFGAMLEQAQRVSHRSTPCRKCDGTGCSLLSPPEMAARDAQLDAFARQWEAKLARITDPEDRQKGSDTRSDERAKLGELLARSADCRSCSGTGLTPPRKVPRGFGDSVATSVPCPKCGGGCVVGAPDEWHIRRLVAELADLPAAHLFVPSELATVARNAGAALPEEGRWNRVVEIMKRICSSGIVTELAEPGGANMPAMDRNAVFRALRDVMRDRCTRCDGNGWVVPVCVRETGSSIAHGGSEGASAVTVASHGELDHVMDRMRQNDSVAALALVLYLGPAGNRWGHHEQGRMFALWPLTKPGGQLARESIERSQAEHDHTPDPHEAILTELKGEASAAQMNPRRRALLDNARDAAQHLLERARREWTKAVLEVGHGAEDAARVEGREADLDFEAEQAIRDRAGRSSAWAESATATSQREEARSGSGVDA